MVMGFAVPGCGGEVAPPRSTAVQGEALSASDLLPAACVADPSTLTCAKAAFSMGKDAFNTAKSILSFLGLIDQGPTIDERLATISSQLTEVQAGVAALHTQVADLRVTVGGYADWNVKILVWDRVSELASLQNDLQIARLYQSPDWRGQVLHDTNNLAAFLANDVLFQDGPDASLGYHTPMYAGMALIQATSAYASAVEVEASLDPLAWDRYSFRGDLRGYATALRRVSGYAAEWANANVTLTLADADPADDFPVPITRPCPTGSTVVKCGLDPDFVGKVCWCRNPVWELSFAGKLQRTYSENLAALCPAPTSPRTPNSCLSFPSYRAVFEQGQADFRAQVGVQDYLDAADLVDDFVDRNSP
jgi:hypothetical protein